MFEEEEDMVFEYRTRRRGLVGSGRGESIGNAKGSKSLGVVG
jgi:hypothetical protein